MLLGRIFYGILLIAILIALPGAKNLLVGEGVMNFYHYGLFASVLAFPLSGLIVLQLYESRRLEGDKLSWPFAAVLIAIIFAFALEKHETGRISEVNDLTSRALAQAKEGREGSKLCEELRKFSEQEVKNCLEKVKRSVEQN